MAKNLVVEHITTERGDNAAPLADFLK